MILDDIIEVYRFVDDIPERQGTNFDGLRISGPFYSAPVFIPMNTPKDKSEIEIGFLIPKSYNFGIPFDFEKDLSIGWRKSCNENQIINPDEDYLFYPILSDNKYWYGYYRSREYEENIERSKQRILKKIMKTKQSIIKNIENYDTIKK